MQINAVQDQIETGTLYPLFSKSDWRSFMGAPLLYALLHRHSTTLFGSIRFPNLFQTFFQNFKNFFQTTTKYMCQLKLLKHWATLGCVWHLSDLPHPMSLVCFHTYNPLDSFGFTSFFQTENEIQALFKALKGPIWILNLFPVSKPRENHDYWFLLWAYFALHKEPLLYIYYDVFQYFKIEFILLWNILLHQCYTFYKMTS